MCICQILCVRPSRLYIFKYMDSRPMSDLWNIILNTIKVNVIDCVLFALQEYLSEKQFFLATGFYTLWSDFSHRLRALFIAAFSGLFCPAAWTMVLVGFNAPKIKATVCANTLHESIFCREARIIVRNTPRKFRTNV